MSSSGEDQKAVSPWLIAPVVALAAFMEVMDISVANVALPHIAGDLSVSQDESTWTLTSYLVTNAIVMPISGWLSGRFGRKRFFLTCIAGFTAASLLCGLATGLGMLTVLRAVQGAAGGGLQPTGQAILTDAFPGHQRGMATAIYGMAVVFAPAIGPTLGGWITDNYEWRWVFLINVPVGIALFFLIGYLLRGPREGAKAQHGRTDWAGLALIALFLGCLQVVMDRGQEDDWFASTMIAALSLISGSALILLIWWEVPHENPMVDLTLLKRRDFGIAFVLMLFFGFMILGTTYLLPAYAQNLMGYRATEAGEILAPGGLLLVSLFPLVGQIINKVDLRLLLGFGILVSGLSIWWMTNFYLEISMGRIEQARVMQAVGLASLFLPINSLAFRGLPADRTNYASALINLARNFGGSIGISTASTLVTRRQQFHQTRIVEHLQPLNPGFSSYLDHIGQATHAAPGSMEPFARAVQAAMQQIMLLSYMDAFKFFAIVFLSLLPLLLFLKPGAATGGAREAG